MMKSGGKKWTTVLDDKGEERYRPGPDSLVCAYHIHHYLDAIVATKCPRASLSNPTGKDFASQTSPVRYVSLTVLQGINIRTHL